MLTVRSARALQAGDVTDRIVQSFSLTSVRQAGRRYDFRGGYAIQKPGLQK